MTRPTRPLTTAEKRQLFEAALREAVDRGVVYSHNGVDDDVDEALMAIASAYPHVTPDLIDAAERAFAGQLDGSNAARAEQEMRRRFGITTDDDA
ncbi:hypothetical protein IU443_29755 [Nocardia farcinica]|uniref:hypothetical protein n=1 Tax=Nocardia farcinica TaxID=37329 RepID=UPI001893E3A0|nr:hypothetical protein [Nocardia farcinica]MBF6394117.1 hypothetical protein [Nocardia farcinica]